MDLLRSHPAALLGCAALEVEADGILRIVVATDLNAAETRFGGIQRFVDLAEVVRTQFGGLALVVPAD